MATNIGTAYVQILPSAQGIKGNLEKILGAPADEAGDKAGKGFAGKFLGAMGGLGKGVAVAVTALGAGATAAGGAFAAAAGGVAQYGDNIDKMSQKMGLSAEKYQEWDAILQHSGTSMEAMKAGMKTLANAAETGNKAFAELGLTQEQVAGMSQEELFEATLAGLQNVEDTTKRTYLAGKLLGRGATELGPLLNTSAEDTEKMRKAVHDLGGVMSNDAVKAAAQFQDSLQDMKTAIGGAGRSAVAEFLPGLSGVMDGIGDIFAGRKGTGKIERGVDKLISAAETVVPKAMQAGSKIVDKLGTALLDNAPRLMAGGAQMTLSVVRGILTKLPELPGAAMAMAGALLSTLSEQLPTLIPAGVSAALNFVDGIVSHPDALIRGGLELLVALAEGVANGLPTLVEQAPVIVLHFAQALIRLAPEVLYAGGKLLWALLDGIGAGLDSLYEMGGDAVGRFLNGVKAWGNAMWRSGADLLDMFVDGILSRFRRLADTVRSAAQTVRDYLGFSEPKEGPLSNFHTYAPDMMELYAQGIRDGSGRVRSALEESLDVGEALRLRGAAALPALSFAGEQTPEPRFVGGSAPRRSSEGGMTVVLQLDRTELGRALVDVVDEERQRVGVRLER